MKIFSPFSYKKKYKVTRFNSNDFKLYKRSSGISPHRYKLFFLFPFLFIFIFVVIVLQGYFAEPYETSLQVTLINVMEPMSSNASSTVNLQIFTNPVKSEIPSFSINQRVLDVRIVSSFPVRDVDTSTISGYISNCISNYYADKFFGQWRLK